MKLRTGVALVGLASVGVAAAVGYGLLRQVAPIFRPDECTATVDGRTVTLDVEQAENAALITAVAIDRGMPARAATIALATAYQESKLYNLESGDRDSLGLFQQRPSQGWGSRAQILDPYYAANAFYDQLAKLDGYEGMRVTVAAQRVQRSGFPEAYAQHESRARAWASALTGWSPAILTCRLHDADPGAASADAVVARVQRDLGAVPVAATPLPEGGTELVLDTSAVGAEADRARLDWAVAQWAVSVAQPLQLTAVDVADQTWDREQSTWAPSTDPLPAGSVRLQLAG